MRRRPEEEHIWGGAGPSFQNIYRWNRKKEGNNNKIIYKSVPHTLQSWSLKYIWGGAGPSFQNIYRQNRKEEKNNNKKEMDHHFKMCTIRKERRRRKTMKLLWMKLCTFLVILYFPICLIFNLILKDFCSPVLPSPDGVSSPVRWWIRARPAALPPTCC